MSSGEFLRNEDPINRVTSDSDSDPYKNTELTNKELRESGKKLYQKALGIVNEKGIWGKPPYGEGFVEDSPFHKGTPTFLGPIDEGTTDAVVLGFIAKAENCKQFKDFTKFTNTILIFIKKPMAEEIRTVIELQEGGEVFYYLPAGKHKISKRWPRADESQLFDYKEKIDKLLAFLNKNDS